MNRILVLVDFTTTSEIALDQAIALAKSSGSSVTLFHVTGSNTESERDEIKLSVLPYEEKLKAADLAYDFQLESGKFMSVVTNYVNTTKPDLIVVGTHGKQGIRQNLFGSNIYKLIKATKKSTLVVNDQFKNSGGAFMKVLLPVSAHKDYLIKVKQTCELLSKEGEIVLLNIVKDGVDFDKNIAQNIHDSKAFFEHNNINFRYVELESLDFSVGYSKETIRYAAVNDFDMISIMTEVASIQEASAHIDKENMLLNTDGIAILCVAQ
jgi:nucleotide-binding universal stress UspA family protein